MENILKLKGLCGKEEKELEDKLEEKELDKVTEIDEPRHIYIYEEIGEKVCRKVIEKLTMYSLFDPYEPIVMYINSPGGSVLAGLAIIDFMRAIPCEIITVINGAAVSMGGLISICGDYRVITENAYWMGHPMKGGAYGDTVTRKDRIEFSAELEHRILKIVKKRTKLKAKDMKKFICGELWLNSEDALAKRVVDKIISSPFGNLPRLLKEDTQPRKVRASVKETTVTRDEAKKAAKVAGGGTKPTTTKPNTKKKGSK